MDSKKYEKRLAKVLADFVVKGKFESLPPETVEKAKEFALDLIGCMIGSSKRPQINILTEVIKAEGGNSRSSVVAHGFKTSMMNAALLNGTSSHDKPVLGSRSGLSGLGLVDFTRHSS